MRGTHAGLLAKIKK